MVGIKGCTFSTSILPTPCVQWEALPLHCHFLSFLQAQQKSHDGNELSGCWRTVCGSLPPTPHTPQDFPATCSHDNGTAADHVCTRRAASEAVARPDALIHPAEDNQYFTQSLCGSQIPRRQTYLSQMLKTKVFCVRESEVGLTVVRLPSRIPPWPQSMVAFMEHRRADVGNWAQWK